MGKHNPAEEEEWHGVLLPQKSQALFKRTPSNPIESKKVVINGIVSVGHSSDTETESSADETSASGQKRGQRRMRTRRERTGFKKSASGGTSTELESTEKSSRTSHQEAGLQEPVAAWLFKALSVNPRMRTDSVGWL